MTGQGIWDKSVTIANCESQRETEELFKFGQGVSKSLPDQLLQLVWEDLAMIMGYLLLKYFLYMYICMYMCKVYCNFYTTHIQKDNFFSQTITLRIFLLKLTSTKMERSQKRNLFKVQSLIDCLWWYLCIISLNVKYQYNGVSWIQIPKGWLLNQTTTTNSIEKSAINTRSPAGQLLH